MKVCSKCGEEKENSQFPKQYRKTNPSELKSRCKSCENKRRNERRKSIEGYNEREALRNKRYRKANPQKMEERKSMGRKWYIQRKYGLSIEEVEAMEKVQDGLCAICRVEDGTCIDHCHSTGKVRALLCMQCNLGLGGFKDNTDFLEAAILYLKKHQ